MPIEFEFVLRMCAAFSFVHRSELLARVEGILGLLKRWQGLVRQSVDRGVKSLVGFFPFHRPNNVFEEFCNGFLLEKCMEKDVSKRWNPMRLSKRLLKGQDWESAWENADEQEKARVSGIWCEYVARIGVQISGFEDHSGFVGDEDDDSSLEENEEEEEEEQDEQSASENGNDVDASTGSSEDELMDMDILN
eukprot:GABV01009653.1.p1 GENE.GABV01009653.1~~GABV01009653.1.p1  ORF type:complete len:202 (+),score=48.87 GABV01009653.1:33-608(+)